MSRMLWGLKYSSPAVSKAAWKICRIGPLVLQLLLPKPSGAKVPSSLTPISVAGNSGSWGPRVGSALSSAYQSLAIDIARSLTGMRNVRKLLLNLVLTWRASWSTKLSSTLMSPSRKDPNAATRAPVTTAKATTARLRRSRGVPAGIEDRASSTWARVGTRFSPRAWAIATSLSLRLK